MTAYTLDSKATVLVECPRCVGSKNFPVYRHIWNGDCFLCCGNGKITAKKLEAYRKEKGIKPCDYSAFTFSLFVDSHGKPERIEVTEKSQHGERRCSPYTWDDDEQSWWCEGRRVETQWLRDHWALYKKNGSTMRKQVIVSGTKGKLKKWIDA